MTEQLQVRPKVFLWQFIFIVSFIEIFSELVLEHLLKYLGLQPDSLPIHYAKLIVEILMTSLVAFLWIRWRQRWMNGVQERLAESQEDYHSLFEHSRDAERIISGTVLKLEALRKRKDGNNVEVSLTESPIFSSDGRVVSIAVIAKDLTEFRRTERAVLRADKLALTDELAAGIAHEIRNPLTAIQGYLQLMRSHFDPKYLDVLLPEVKRINDITDEFLLLSKPQIEARESADIRNLLQTSVYESHQEFY